MLGKLLFVSVVVAGAVPLQAHARESVSPAIMQPSRSVELQLAQSGDLEVYYDGLGRRVLIDPYTGEILSIQRPRRGNARPARRQPPRDRYYLDDPEDMTRLRQDRMRQLGRAAPEGEFAAPEDPYGREPAYQEAFPEAPPPGVRKPAAQPRTVTRGPVKRQPLAPAIQRDVDTYEPTVEASIPGEQPSDVIVEPTNPASAPAAIEPPVTSKARIEVAELQVLLDRKGISPGVIDGHFGGNVDKGLAAYREATGLVLRSTDAAGIKKALADSGGDAFTSYTISAEDAAGPFVASVPSDYGEKAKLDRLSYTSVIEMLAERFHMDERYLKALNPSANFGRPGTMIRVANVGGAVKTPVARIVADKRQKQVRAYDAGGKLVAAYPATIGSGDTPSPTGTHTVARIAINPEYTYNPKINFKQGENHDILKIPPGPNGPVGSVWIALSKPTYGIHGTPDPSKIGKTESHGCVRLTNWDAQELAKIVKAGVSVEFLE
ncbi:L,D-transpeptidase family protein [Mesorhizobium sp. NBSH29]|uniref:L,D-transpeptidase n=1 Tax=Mesorhizobium sp. NBSH29 TaxID=2654249 RepID=UPI001896A417|nr:L,D-transpeptidase [Mesorhizobium sp. NBSH29]QPC88471.1 L,D-transpeptidase family protein [Mesorhizobium sp. NBSH29]